MANQNQRKHRQIIPLILSPESYYHKGVRLYEKGDLNRASQFLARALEMNPDNVEFLCRQAVVLAELECYETSNQLLRKVIYELDAPVTACHFFMANNYAYLGNLEAALKEARHYILSDPEGEYAEEAQQLYHALTDDVTDDESIYDVPDYVELHDAAVEALDQGLFDKAVRLFEEVTATQPDFLPAQNNLSVAFFSLGQRDQAVRAAEQVLACDPGNIYALCNLASFHYQTGEEAAFKSVCNRLERISPLNADYCGKLGSTYLNFGMDRKALFWLNTAERRGVQTDQVFHFWQALAAWHLGYVRTARRRWQQVDYFSAKPFHPFKYEKIQDMLFAPDARENFMVRELVVHELSGGDPAYRLFAFFYLHARFPETEVTDLKLTDPSLHGLLERLRREEEEQQTDGGLETLRHIRRLCGGERRLLEAPELYRFWLATDELALLQTRHAVDWAAALVYLHGKEYGPHLSQQSLAAQADTTVYRLRQCIEMIRQAFQSSK